MHMNDRSGELRQGVLISSCVEIPRQANALFTAGNWKNYPALTEVSRVPLCRFRADS